MAGASAGASSRLPVARPEGETLLLVVSGASGAGKSTARAGAAPLLGEGFEAVECADLAPVPAVPTTAWRQEVVEVAARRALTLHAEGRHLLLAGDPVPAGEALAAPSSEDLDIAVCLFDVDAEVQTARLRARGEPEQLLVHHVAFAAWMRRHATDPGHMQHVLTGGGWAAMRWERWNGLRAGDPRWGMRVVDTSTAPPHEVAGQVVRWCRDALAGRAPVFRAGWWRDPAAS